MNLFKVSTNLLNEILAPTRALRNESDIQTLDRIRTFSKMVDCDLDVPRVHHPHNHINLRLSVSEWIVFWSHRVQSFVGGSEEFTLILE